MGSVRTEAGPPARTVAIAVVGYFGLAMCITLVYLGMRAVMDVGGACADGGAYLSAQPCPNGAAALPIGILGLFLFGAIALVGGTGVGGAWAGAPILAWAGLFGSLGWNFLDYGWLNAPAAANGPIWGWIMCGAVFWIMAFPPLLMLRPGRQPARRTGKAPPVMVRPMPMSGPMGLPSTRSAAAVQRPERPSREAPGYAARAARRGLVPSPATDPAPVLLASGEDLAALVSGEVLGEGPAMAPGPAGAPAHLLDGTSFQEDTQALLDRLERLAGLRDRGLLSVVEFETAKATIVAELAVRA